MPTYTTGPRVCLARICNFIVRIDRLLCVRRDGTSVWLLFEGRTQEVGIDTDDKAAALNLFNEIDRMMTKWLTGQEGDG